MATQEMFDRYAQLRQTHRRIFSVLEEYRREHADFRFSVRKQDKKDRLTYGLIFKGNDNYIEVGLSNENDKKNTTRTVFLKFDVAAGNVSRLSFNVAYSLTGEINAERMQLYCRLCERFQVPLQELENATRIKGEIEIVRSPNDWEQPLRNWLDNNYGVMRNEFNDVLIDEDEFLQLLRKQVERGVLSCDEHGYSINENYVPAFDVVPRHPDRPAGEEDDDDEDDDDDPTACDTIKDLLLYNFQAILTGAPGTGKTYAAREVAKAIVGAKTDDDATDEAKENAKRIEEERIASIQFHPGYDYSDFVIGMKPVLLTEGGKEVEKKDGKYFLVGTKTLVEKLGKAQVSFRWKDGIFKKFADKARKAYDAATKDRREPPKFVFLIDEINRADLSRVFGELFSLLEEEYRYPNEKWMGITLPNGDYFVIPKNLYIIGTMNDIDRSVESMDFALRRRFAWYEVSAEDSKCIVDKKVDADPAAKLKNAMDALNSEIANPAFRLGAEYQLGGAIFAKYAKYNGKEDAFENLWKNHIEIIVKEYLRGRRTRDDDLKKLKDIYDEHVRPPRQQLEPQPDAEQQPRDEQQ